MVECACLGVEYERVGINRGVEQVGHARILQRCQWVFPAIGIQVTDDQHVATCLARRLQQLPRTAASDRYALDQAVRRAYPANALDGKELFDSSADVLQPSR